MDTSRSTNRKYFAGVSIFSGRPDPTWPVSDALALDLLTLFDTSARSDSPPPTAPPLGYRGAFLRDDAGNEWHAYRGVVTAQRSNARLDANRTFERTLIDSIPDGLLSRDLLNKEFD